MILVEFVVVFVILIDVLGHQDSVVVVVLVTQREKLVNHFVLEVKNVKIHVTTLLLNVRTDVMTYSLIKVVTTLVIKHLLIVRAELTKFSIHVPTDVNLLI